MDTFHPDIVVGVDFGMTCTGVAYSWGPDWADPKTIQHWPGKLGHEIRNKVDTAIAYDKRTGNPVSWGFLVDYAAEEVEIQELFKLYLDYAYEDEFKAHATVDMARGWLKDYLTYLCNAVARNFDESLPRWRSKNVEFNFSVPTTWKEPGMITDIEGIIKSAGFTAQSNFRARVTLTEAEAAAVSVSKQHLEKGDCYVVCDAGGGTTDVNVLKIQTTASGQTILDPLSWVEGRAIGSTIIDFKMENFIRQRLEKIRHVLPMEPDLLAAKMVNHRFETYKCSFGTDAYAALDLVIPIPGLPAGSDFPHAEISDSKLIIKRADLQRLFDEQINKMTSLVDAQLHRLQSTHPREKVSYIVLSGGLGSSPYVRQQFRKRYQLGDIGLPNAASVEVLTTREPQLAVVHGLVLDRIQALKFDTCILPARCSRHSYGIVVRVLYDPVEHLGADIVIDPRDKSKWAEQQIHWLVRQGETISTEKGVSNRYRLKINLGRESIPWRTQIVMSSLPSNQLPRSMKSNVGVKTVCLVETVMDKRDLKLKNRHWYNFGPQYYRAEFDVKILVGSADLKFQIWGEGGRRLSKEHDEIEVSWSAPNSPVLQNPTSGEEINFGMYRM
ncbi:hypothetical protein PV08_09682 [Exophiala spinifera]|uniref:Uncharacterized protein n=1 Tax=Exophiala spinifera TaxID=91928 RepID=A0A0D2B149_9EURO|nr:uncharacterized protein PV08_09682 [Exophiala spinifera]KIW12405.1 hypothetical protein PV08_09682 [Exophiala spinifera]